MSGYVSEIVSNSQIMSKAFIRKPAPQFTAKAYMPSGEFKEVKLSDYKGKYVVLFFWPLDFTFVCPTEIIAYGKMTKQFEANNTVLLGCSVDSEFTHMEYCLKPRKAGGLGPMECPLLADLTKKISTEYGCLIPEDGVAFRATYIIDDKGILRHISISDLPVGRNPNQTLRLVQAFQFTDKHGEVCPASWKPGDKTMEPKVGSKKNEEVFNAIAQ